MTLTGELVRSICPPLAATTRCSSLIPGVVTNVNDTVTGTATTSFPIHGGRTNEGRLSLDGLTVGSPPSGNSATSYVVDVGNAQEVDVHDGGRRWARSETAGLVMNIVPKSGGNAMHGVVLRQRHRRRSCSPTISRPHLRAQGVTAATPLTKVYDVSGTIGGPICEGSAVVFRQRAHRRQHEGQRERLLQPERRRSASKWLYAPDVSRREYSDRTFENASGRVTWQVTPRNKVSGFWDAQSLCRTCTGATPACRSPRACRRKPSASSAGGWT